MCTNSIGSYTCSCMTGFVLDANNRTCLGMSTLVCWMHNCHFPQQMSMSASPMKQVVRKYVPTLLEVTSVHACQDLYWVLITQIAMVGSLHNMNPLQFIYFSVLDINECATNNGNCLQLCSNTVGSYYCSCLTGYRLLADNRTCSGEYTLCFFNWCLHTGTCFRYQRVCYQQWKLCSNML